MPAPATRHGSALEVLLVSLRLGVTSFGGPIAHLGYFRDEYVTRRAWVSDEGFADVVALCQFLPGPASSQVNMAIGMARAGLPGALAAWAGFTLPSAAALTAFAFVAGAGGLIDSGWMHGLMLAAVAVVAQALVAMARRLTPDAPRIFFAVFAAIVALLVPASLTQLALIAAGGIAGRLFLRSAATARGADLRITIPRAVSIGSLALFVLLIAGLPVLRFVAGSHVISLLESFYRTGALVFGGGHVVLPLLHAETVLSGWVSDPQFLAGYGAAQAVPGPLFTFAAYLGAIEGPTPNGIPGAFLALGAIFLPSFLLLAGVLPFWASLRAKPGFQSVLAGVNAAVVGLLAAALYTPVWTGSVRTPPDFCIALACFVLLAVKKVRPWMVVGLGAAAGAAVRLLS